MLNISIRTIERWRTRPEDERHGPRTRPANQLAAAERKELLKAMNSKENRDLSPNQIVPRLADQGVYLASESTMYRVLREEGQLAHRGSAKAPQKRQMDEHIACAPNQVWSWDITYLKAPTSGMFFYLYMVIDIYSRRIMGWEVHLEESAELASGLFIRLCRENQINPDSLVLHSDNGPAMKGSTLLATLQSLGVCPSFSRPRISDDNAFSEALFRTLKYRPTFPDGRFTSLEEAQRWVKSFVTWYNSEHQHSGIRFVTPDDRHFGRDSELLAHRHLVYQQARRARPERWSRQTRNWLPVGPASLRGRPQPTTCSAAGRPLTAKRGPVDGDSNTHRNKHPSATRGGAANGVTALSAGTTFVSDERGSQPHSHERYSASVQNGSDCYSTQILKAS